MTGAPQPAHESPARVEMSLDRLGSEAGSFHYGRTPRTARPPARGRAGGRRPPFTQYGKSSPVRIRHSVASATSVDLMSAMTLLPSTSPRSSAASLVIDEVI